LKENFSRCVEPVVGKKQNDGPWIIGEGVLFTDVVSGNVKLDEVKPDQREEMRKYVERMCDEFNTVTSKAPLNIVIFDYVVLHTVRIARILTTPKKGHAFLIGL
jgi:hypothetical protein